MSMKPSTLSDRPTVTIDRNQLLRLLLRLNDAAKPAYITAVTFPTVRKTGNPYLEIRKLSGINVFLNDRYEASVNRAREREGSAPVFDAKELPWGQWVSPCVIQHKEAMYLRARVIAARKPIYLARRGEGDLLLQTPKEVLSPWLPPDRDAGEAQGLDKGVVVRTWKLDSISAITIDRVRYRIERTLRPYATVRTVKPRKAISAEWWHELLEIAAGKMGNGEESVPTPAAIRASEAGQSLSP